MILTTKTIKSARIFDIRKKNPDADMHCSDNEKHSKNILTKKYIKKYALAWLKKLRVVFFMGCV